MVLLFEGTSPYLLLAAAILLYIYFTWTFNYWKNKGVPYVKPLPFFGNIKDRLLMRLSMGEWTKKLYLENEGHRYVGIFQIRTPILLVRDPDVIKDMLVRNFPSFHDRGLPMDEENQPLTAHLFSLPGRRWRLLRSKLTPTFTTGKIKQMYHLMEECCEVLHQQLEEAALQEGELDMKEMMAQFSTDIIGSCAFGLQMNAIKDSNAEFRQMGRMVFSSSFEMFLRRTIVLLLPRVAKFFNIKFGDPRISRFFMKAVKDTMDYREKNGVIRHDFMDLLLQLKHKGRVDDDHESVKPDNADNDTMDIEITDNLLAAQAFVFFVAGFETTSTTLSFTLYELAVNPDVQTHLREEIDAVLLENDGKLTYDALHQMQYLEKVIYESLRKYPPSEAIIRVCTKDYTLPDTNIVIEKGTYIVIPTFAIQRDPNYYPDPERYDPERFSEANKAKRPHCTFLAFGDGPRNCIGMRFGMLEAKLGIATLVRDFEFLPCKRTMVPIRFHPNTLTTTSRDGVYIKIRPRK